MRALRLYVPVYSITLLLSAFLLFAIQPMFSKMVLPLLGGSPAVWNTAMVFFQAMLLGGYAYAHLTSRYLKPSAQAILHIVLLLICALALPIAIPENWREPPAVSNPAFWQLAMMAVAVGGPFFVLSGTAPMLQRWFSYTDHPDAHNPYFLYAASNAGSVAALLLYPFIFEPLLTLKGQSFGWTGGYGLLIALTAISAFLVKGRQLAASQGATGDTVDDKITPQRVLVWLALAFVPSSLMLGVTTYITTDLASVPLLWIIPLALYVGTFIIAFARVQPIRINTVVLLQTMALLAVVFLFIANPPIHKLAAVFIHLVLFFLTALMCHMQLAALRPGARNLTAFYLIMSAGGVLGGMFNALLAPQIFVIPIEYALVLAYACFLRYQVDPAQSFRTWLKDSKKFHGGLIVIGVAILAWRGMTVTMVSQQFIVAVIIAGFLFYVMDKRWMFALAATLVLLCHPGFRWHTTETIKAWDRNFFGVMRVADTPEGYRHLVHGTTVHGSQPLDKKYEFVPVTYYYNKGTPAANVFEYMDSLPGPQRIGTIGLGIGSIACYKKEGRHIDFFEIDPDVERIAEDSSLFTYLSGCGTSYDVIIGDGRLKMEKAPDDHYDMIFLDAFSSDNIPIHIMTREAFEIYIKKLKPDGLIASNISNRYIDLEPVMAAIARDLGLKVMFKRYPPGTDEETGLIHFGTIFMVMAEDYITLESFRRNEEWYELDIPAAQKAWSDDYSNIVQALRLKKPALKHTLAK